MTEEEIEKRIEHCEIMEMSHREVGNTKSTNRYNNEKYKWEKLLEKLDPKKDEELRTYKIGYYNLKQALNEIREYVNSDKLLKRLSESKVNNKGETQFDLIREDILQIIDKVGGSDEI